VDEPLHVALLLVGDGLMTSRPSTKLKAGLRILKQNWVDQLDRKNMREIEIED
jgi:hypothetical protein